MIIGLLFSGMKWRLGFIRDHCTYFNDLERLRLLYAICIHFQIIYYLFLLYLAIASPLYYIDVKYAEIMLVSGCDKSFLSEIHWRCFA